MTSKKYPSIVCVLVIFIAATNAQSHSLFFGSCNADNGSDLLYQEVINIKNEHPKKWYSSFSNLFSGSTVTKASVNTTFVFPPDVSWMGLPTTTKKKNGNLKFMQKLCLYRYSCFSFCFVSIARVSKISALFAAYKQLTRPQMVTEPIRKLLAAVWDKHGHRSILNRNRGEAFCSRFQYMPLSRALLHWDRPPYQRRLAFHRRSTLRSNLHQANIIHLIHRLITIIEITKKN